MTAVRPVIRWAILLAGLMATASLAGCGTTPQSLGITGPGDQQKAAGVRHGARSQHNPPYLGAVTGSQQG
jgi:hypothetical protein